MHIVLQLRCSVEVLSRRAIALSIKNTNRKRKSDSTCISRGDVSPLTPPQVLPKHIDGVDEERALALWESWLDKNANSCNCLWNYMWLRIWWRKYYIVKHVFFQRQFGVECDGNTTTMRLCQKYSSSALFCRQYLRVNAKNPLAVCAWRAVSHANLKRIANGQRSRHMCS